MRVLITGGVGSLGMEISKAFLQDGFNVRLLIRNRRYNRRRANKLGGNVEIIYGDVTEPDSVREALEGVDAVIHLAGLILPDSERNPDLTYRINVGGTQTVVNMIKEQGKSIPFVYTSSASIFGPTPNATEPLDLDKCEYNPTDIYTKTKVQSEELIKESGIDYIILRLTAVLNFDLKISQMKDHTFRIPLNNRIEFCHVYNVALAMINAVKNFDKVKGHILTVAGGSSQQMIWGEMLERVLGTFGLPLPPKSKFAQSPFCLDWYDTSKSQELLDYQKKTMEDYYQEFAAQFPRPLITVMQRYVGPAIGKHIVRLM